MADVLHHPEIAPASEGKKRGSIRESSSCSSSINGTLLIGVKNLAKTLVVTKIKAREPYNHWISSDKKILSDSCSSGCCKVAFLLQNLVSPRTFQHALT